MYIPSLKYIFYIVIIDWIFNEGYLIPAFGPVLDSAQEWNNLEITSTRFRWRPWSSSQIHSVIIWNCRRWRCPLKSIEYWLRTAYRYNCLLSPVSGDRASWPVSLRISYPAHALLFAPPHQNRYYDAFVSGTLAARGSTLAVVWLLWRWLSL